MAYLWVTHSAKETLGVQTDRDSERTNHPRYPKAAKNIVPFKPTGFPHFDMLSASNRQSLPHNGNHF